MALSEAARDQSQNDMFWIRPNKLRIHYSEQPFTHLGDGYEIYAGWKYFDDGVIQQVSIKIYRQNRRAEKETELLKSFRHDRIIKFIEAGEYNLGPFKSYIVTEHFSRNVEEFVKDSDKNLDEFKSIFQQLLDGLFYIHWRRIIHGSLHPSNIVICPSGAAKISDFGHASIAPSSIASIRNGYQPPEILLENKDVETSADIFSLGIVMAYIISKGKHPFGDSNEQCFNIKNAKPPNLSIIPNLDHKPGLTKSQVLDVLKIMLLKIASNRPAADQIAKNALFQALQIEDRFIATKNYEAHALTELSFCKGAVIVIQGKPDGIFWKGRHLLSGNILDVPKSFLMPASRVQCQKWFFGRLNIRQAVRLLTRKGNEVGTFLVRENEDSEGKYYMSILEKIDSNLCVKHYPINCYQDDKFGMSSTQRYEYLDELVRDCQSKLSVYNLKTVCPINEVFAETSTAIDDINIPKRLLRNKEKISEGHFGELWKGKWNGNTKVLIKKLDFVVNEFAAFHMKTMRHENIIGFHSLISDQPTWIMVEFFGMANLHNHLNEQRKCCNCLDFVDMSAQIADGMAYLEKMNFVHGRLSGESVLIDDRRICKIADYGLEPVSYIQRRLSECDQENEIANEEFTTKSDVWNFGAVLFEIFTGRDPYSENMTPLPDEFPDDIHKLFLACREEYPNERPTFNYAKTLLIQCYKNLAYNHHRYTDDSSSSEFDSSDDIFPDPGQGSPQTWRELNPPHVGTAIPSTAKRNRGYHSVQSPEISHNYMPLPVRTTDSFTARRIRGFDGSFAIRNGSTDRTRRVLYNYTARAGSELNVKTGDIVSLVQHGDDGWSMVRKIGGGAEGLVPTIYIENTVDYLNVRENI